MPAPDCLCLCAGSPALHILPHTPCRYGVKSHLVPHCHYLKSLGIAQEELPQLILARPQVLVSAGLRSAHLLGFLQGSMALCGCGLA